MKQSALICHKFILPVKEKGEQEDGVASVYQLRKIVFLNFPA